MVIFTQALSNDKTITSASASILFPPEKLKKGVRSPAMNYFFANPPVNGSGTYIPSSQTEK